MVFFKVIRSAFFLSLIVSPYFWNITQLFAQTVNTSDIFSQGTNASRQGDYEKALTLFRRAESAGLTKPALYYNIGVCAYKLGRYAEAEKAFLKTAESPRMASLAYYNLGIIAKKQSNHEKAIYWLQKSSESTSADDEKTRLLADYALAQISGKDPVVVWNRYLSLGLGYDDNVELVATDLLQASHQHDEFLDLFIFLRRPFLHFASDTGSHLQSSFSFLKYADLSEYDTGSANVEYYYWKKFSSLQIEGGGSYAFTLLDGRSYEQSPLLSIQAKYIVNPETSVRLRYRINYHDVLDKEYDYLTGWRHRTQTELFRSWGKVGASLSYTLELNDRDDKDYSPTRHTAAVGMKVKPLEKLDINLNVSYRDSHYDLESLDDRDENQLNSSIEFMYFLPAEWELSCRYQYTDNNANDDYYDYTRNMVVLSLARFF
ncbi:MAG: tetratricopeptide repeat protein [Pseudomonadota bacterium]